MYDVLTAQATLTQPGSESTRLFASRAAHSEPPSILAMDRLFHSLTNRALHSQRRLP